MKAEKSTFILGIIFARILSFPLKKILPFLIYDKNVNFAKRAYVLLSKSCNKIFTSWVNGMPLEVNIWKNKDTSSIANGLRVKNL